MPDFPLGMLTGAAALIILQAAVIAWAVAGTARDEETWLDDCGHRPHPADGSSADVAPFHEASNA